MCLVVSFGFVPPLLLSKLHITLRRRSLFEKFLKTTHVPKINKSSNWMASMLKYHPRTAVIATHTFVLSLLLSRSFMPVDASVERKVIEGHVKVVDGDTIRFLHGPRVRLSDIDAPELKQTCLYQKDGRTYPCGKESKETLENIVRNHKVYCESDQRDIYGRWLGTCWTLEQGQKRVNINQKMIQLGEAVSYKGTMMYRLEEQAAKFSKKG